MMRGAGRAAEARKSEIARKFARIAPRSTLASVGLITGRFYRRPARQARRSRAALCEILEARVFLDEGELRGAGRPVALLADDDLGDPFVLLIDLAVLIAILLRAIDEHHHVGILL